MIKIKYDNIWAQVDQCPPNISILLQDSLKYHPDGYAHQYAYKAKKWDGYKYIYDLKNNRFRRGLLARVEKLLRDHGETVVLEDATTDTQELAHKFEGGLLRALAFQEQAANAAETHDMGLIVSPTGSGKTVIAAKTIASIKRRTLVIVTDIVLLDQMQQALQKWFDQPIGIIGDGEFELEDITVSTIQSIASILKLKSKKPAALDKYNKLIEFIHDVGLVLSDEAHLSDSESFDTVMPNFKNTKRFLGLSATPYGWAEKSEKRSNMALEQHFGSVIFDARNNDFITMGVKSPLNVYVHKLTPVNLEYTKHYKYGYGGRKQPDSSKNYRDCLETEILNNEVYQSLVAHDAMNQVAAGKSVFVHAVHSLEFGDALAERLPGALVVNGKTPRAKRREIYEAIEKKEQMILVSDVGGTGLNIPSLDTIILASDLVDIRQIKGRVERASPGKTCGNIIDYHIDTMFLGKHHETRISQYENDNNRIIYEEQED